MRSEWHLMKACDFIAFNPKESISKNIVAKKVSMDKLQPFTRDIHDYTLEPFTGGAKFRNGDTILARITPCLENGKTAQINILDEGEVAFGSTEFIVLRAKPGISDRNFIYYFSISAILREPAIKSMVGSSGRQRVQQDVLSNLDVYLPSLPEQKAIAAVLSALDDKIEMNNRINQKLEEMAQAIFKSWFVDFEPFQDGEFVESELGEIPAGWRVFTLGEVCAVKGGKRLPKGENLITIPNSHPYIRVRDMNDTIFVQMSDAIEYVSDKIQRTISRYTVSANDVIVSIVGTIGMVCKVHSSLDNANLTENCVKLTDFCGVTSDFVFLFLSSPLGQEAINRGIVGAVQAKLPIKNIQAITFACPSTRIMYDFGSIISQPMQAIANIYTENQRLSALRDTLLPKLMSGELRVPCDTE